MKKNLELLRVSWTIRNLDKENYAKLMTTTRNLIVGNKSFLRCQLNNEIETDVTVDRI